MFERQVPPTVAVLSLQAPLPEPAPLGGFSWWRIDADEEERTAAVLHAVERLTDAIERFVELHELRPTRRIALGFSQGAALISAALLSQRLRVDGAALLAGFVVEPPAPSTVAPSESSTVAPSTIAAATVAPSTVAPSTVAPFTVHGKPKVFVAHGTKDEVISIERARRGAKLLASLGLPVTHVEDEVGHKVGIQGTRALKAWLHDILG